MQKRRRAIGGSLAVRSEALTNTDSFANTYPNTHTDPDADADTNTHADTNARRNLRMQAAGKVGPRKTGNKLKSLDRSGGRRRKRTHSRRKPLR